VQAVANDKKNLLETPHRFHIVLFSPEEMNEECLNTAGSVSVSHEAARSPGGNGTGTN